jgi:hypothetical protein
MAKSRWTVLTYIAAHNNLALLGKQSLYQIVTVGSTADVVHGVLYDAPDVAGRYLIGSSGTVREQEQFDTFDGGDPDALIETAKWLFEKQPAERYALVLWSHGTGWTPSEIATVATEARPGATNGDEPHERAVMPGALTLFRTTLRAMQKPQKRTDRAILFDDGTGHSLDTLELDRVMRAVAKTIGQPIDLLGMDACLMASLEVAFQIKDSVRVVAASEELVPGHSWPYPAIYGELAEHPEQDARDLAKVVVDRYVDFYTKNPPGAGDVTKVAVDLSSVDTLATATRGFADALLTDMPRHARPLWNAQLAAKENETSKDTRKPNKFDFHLWDLGAIAGRLSESANVSDGVKASATALGKALTPGATILAEGHRGKWFDETRGVSVYLMPPRLQRLSPYYADLAFAKQSHWLDMLTAYHREFA